MKTKPLGKLASVTIVVTDENGASRRVEFHRPEKIQGLLEEKTPLGDFLREVAGVITYKGVSGAN